MDRGRTLVPIPPLQPQWQLEPRRMGGFWASGMCLPQHFFRFCTTTRRIAHSLSIKCYQDVQPYSYILELPPRHPPDYSSEALPCTDDATEFTSKFLLNHGSNGLSDTIHLEQRHLSQDTSLSTDESFYAVQPAQLVPLDSVLSTEKSPCSFYSTFNHTPVGSSDGSPCSASSADTQHPPTSLKDNLSYRLDSQAALKSQQQQVFLPLAQQEQTFHTNRNSNSFPQNNQEQELFLPISEEHQPLLQSDHELQPLLQHAHEQRQLLPTIHEGQMRHQSIHEQEQLGQMSSHRQEQVHQPSYEEELFAPNLERDAVMPPNHEGNNNSSRSIATTAPNMATASIPVEIDVRNVRELLSEYQQRRQSNTSTGSSEKENLTPKQRRRKAQNRAAYVLLFLLTLYLLLRKQRSPCEQTQPHS